MTEKRATYKPFRCPECKSTRRNMNFRQPTCHDCGWCKRTDSEAEKEAAS